MFICIVLGLLAFALYVYHGHQQFVKSLGPENLEILQKKAKSTNLRKQIYNSFCLESQKKMAHEIFCLWGYKTTHIQEVGDLAGIINREYFVFKTEDGCLKSVCYPCVRQMLDKHHPSKHLPISVEAFAVKDLSTTTTIPMVKEGVRRRWYATSIELPFKGEQPVCEMPCCASCKINEHCS